MRPIPKKLREELSSDPFMKVCCLNSGDCDGRIEFDHTIIVGGKQVNERWAIVPVCKYHHDNQEYKEQRQLVALNRATVEELQSISKAIDWLQRRRYLRDKWGRNNK